MAPAAARSQASLHTPGRRHDRHGCSRFAAGKRAHHFAPGSDLGSLAAVRADINVLATVPLCDSFELQQPAASLLDLAGAGAGA